MAEIRDVAQIARKWVRNSAVAGPSYSEGVQNPRRPWQAATLAAQPAWQAGVTAAAQAGRWQAAVRATPEDTQRQMASTKGANRFPEGVAAAEPKYAARFAPYAQVIRGINLPPRGPRGAAANLQRVAAIANALHQRRTQGGPGGG